MDLKNSYDPMLDPVKEEKFEGEIGIPSVGSNQEMLSSQKSKNMSMTEKSDLKIEKQPSNDL